jgi:hypothetical protein
MRRVSALAVLVAGCATSPDYRAGPPVTVSEPVYSGPVVTAPRRNTIPSNNNPAYAPAVPLEPAYAPEQSSSSRFSDWLRSGRGWTWGSASRCPIRDEGLDRLMVDTLTSSSPTRSQEVLPPVKCSNCPSEPWLYPARSAAPDPFARPRAGSPPAGPAADPFP